MWRLQFLILSLMILPHVVTAGDSLGVVAQEPAEGRFVKITEGYMVPYEVKIPGTDASFWMEPIPGGVFRMGSPESEVGRGELEGPRSMWRVEPFWMARCEVTQGEYRHYMAMYSVFRNYSYQEHTRLSGGTRVDAVTAPTVIYEPDYIFEYGDHVDMPIITVTQYAAKQYSKWLSLITETHFRLPTEAEWEYACRAGSTTAWHFGNDPKNLKDYAWYAENSYDEGWRKVGKKKPNSWGLFDMHGNVAEWVHDHCTKYRADDGIRSAARDWVRKAKIDPKTVRGGSWESTAEQCRSASRLASDMETWREDDSHLPKSPWWCTSDPSRGVGLRLMRPLKRMSRSEQDEFWEPLDEETKNDVKELVSGGYGAIGRVSRELMEAIAREKSAQ